MSEEKQCPFPAVYSYKWGGVGETSYACAPHAEQINKLCQHMGWGQHFEQLPPGTGEQCRQQLPEDDPIFTNLGEESPDDC